MASTIQLKTGTGSAEPSFLTQGELAINITNGLVYYGSGSGNTVKQLESFTNITASANISASGNLYGSRAIINRMEHNDSVSNIHFANGIYVAGGNHITSSGNISASGDIYAESIIISGSKRILWSNTSAGTNNLVMPDTGLVVLGRISAGTNITASGNISASGDITSSGFWTSGNISASGDVYATDYFDNNANINTIYSPIVGGTGIVTVGAVNAGSITSGFTSIDVGAGAITTTGTLTGGALVATGNTTLGNAATDTHFFTGHITASNNISASGNIYSNNIEILTHGSARVSTITNTTDYWGPSNQGPFHTSNWNANTTPESSGDLIFTKSDAQKGFIVPYSCSLVGFDAITRMNSGEDVYTSMSLFTANANDMDLANSSNADSWTASLACTGVSPERKDTNSYLVTASCNVPLAPLSVVFPQVKVDPNAAGDGDDDDMTMDISYVIKIKRIK